MKQRGTLLFWALNAGMLILFFILNVQPMDPNIIEDLVLAHIVGHPIIIFMAAGFARLRVAYGRAMARSEDLETMALEDALTGIRNRRAYGMAFKRARARSLRKRSPVCLLLVDIDHFKAVNDELGHSVGDHALRALAGLLLSDLRDSDEVFRYGGEEFVILLEDTPLQVAWEVGDRIRKHIQQAKLIHEREITASMGVAELAEQESEQELFERADAALYEAKRTGRNRVCIARPAGEGSVELQP